MDRTDEHAEALEELLSEPVDIARERASRVLPPLDDAPLLLHGAGNIGTRVLASLRARGVRPAGFIDLAPDKHGRFVEGLPILRPEDALTRFGLDARVLVTVLNTHHAFAATRNAYAAMGASHVISLLAYLWSAPDGFLPYYAMSRPEDVLAARDLVTRALACLREPRSRASFVAYVRWRLRLDFDGLPSPDLVHQYFPPDLVRLGDDETFVDVGAYDGDTFRRFLELTKGRFREAHLFEPDPRNFERLLASLPGGALGAIPAQVRLHQKAVGARSETVRFTGDGLASSAVADDGALEVTSASLDEVLAGCRPTFVKMDIEGAECDAIAGAARVLSNDRPSLAICVYHRPSDPWRIVLELRERLPDYPIHLRAHGQDGWDWVAYALAPAHRALETANQ